MDLVSVVVCCYNGIKYIDRCFSCILSQSYSKIEVLFVDDGSTDNSYQYALSYKRAFEDRGYSLKCFTQINKGAGGAAALGVLNAMGDYISCYDIDDILYPESIEKRVTFLKQHNDYAGVRTNGYMVSSDGKSRSLFVNNKDEKLKEDIFKDLLFGKTNNWSGSYMVRANALWNVYPDHHIIESRFGQNLQILMSVAYQNKIGFIDIPLMEYSYNPDSFTNNSKDLKSIIKNYEGYKGIRIDILKQLGINDRSLYNKLDECYLIIYMDLGLTFNDDVLFKNSYIKLNRMTKIPYIYSYYYYKNNNLLMSLFYRICHVLSKIWQKLNLGFLHRN